MKYYALGILIGSMILVGILIVMLPLRFIKRLLRPAVPRMQVNEPIHLPPPKKKMTASSILLLIGTAFIVLASVAFVAANWNHMESAGKIFTLLGASSAAFAVSAVLNGALELKRTSIAFYSMGMLIAAIAFVTAGYYNLFGSWFSVGGDGEMLLYGAAALIVSAVSFVGYTFYRNTAMHYIGFSFAAFSIIMICGHFADGYAIFAVMLIVVQLIITAVTELLSPGMEKSWGKPLKIIARAAALVYSVCALFYVFYSFIEPDVYTYVIMAAVLVQLFFYGIFKKSKVLIIAADIFALYAALMISSHVEMSYGTTFAKIVFAGITLLIYIANRSVPKFGTAERITALAAAVLGSFVSLGAQNAPLALQIAVPLLVSAAIAEFAFNENIVIQRFAGILFPFMPLLITINICDRVNQIKYDSSTAAPLVYCGYALFCMAAAASALFMRKICFSFHAKHPLKTQAFIYSNLAAAGLTLMEIADCTEVSIVILVLCAVQFALSCLPAKNFTAIASSIAALVTVENLINDLIPDRNDNLKNYILLAVLIVILIASRFVYPDSIFDVKENGKITADVFLMTALLMIITIEPFSGDSRFFIMLSLAVCAAAFVKKRTERKKASCILTGSAVLTAFALLDRPFLVFSSDTVTAKIDLAVFMLLGIACKLIWRDMKQVSKALSTMIFAGCFAYLTIDGIVHAGIFNRIFVLCITALVLVLSFIRKSKTWFIASSVSLVVLTGSFMHKYIASAGWWLYLLIVGIILVTVAAVNEACRKKGENVISTVERKLSDWTW